MQIDIDFEVYKALTMLRQSEGDSYNAVLRRILKLSPQNALAMAAAGHSSMPNALARAAEGKTWISALGKDGAWFDNVHFPNGTLFTAIYKGESYNAEIVDGNWLGADGIKRTSPSAAASAISSTNVNGWKFWHCKLPGEGGWRRMDELKS